MLLKEVSYAYQGCTDQNTVKVILLNIITIK